MLVWPNFQKKKINGRHHGVDINSIRLFFMGLWFHKIIHETLMSCDSAQVEKKISSNRNGVSIRMLFQKLCQPIEVGTAMQLQKSMEFLLFVHSTTERRCHFKT